MIVILKMAYLIEGKCQTDIACEFYDSMKTQEYNLLLPMTDQ